MLNPPDYLTPLHCTVFLQLPQANHIYSSAAQHNSQHSPADTCGCPAAHLAAEASYHIAGRWGSHSAAQKSHNTLAGTGAHPPCSPRITSCCCLGSGNHALSHNPLAGIYAQTLLPMRCTTSWAVWAATAMLAALPREAKPLKMLLSRRPSTLCSCSSALALSGKAAATSCCRVSCSARRCSVEAAVAWARSGVPPGRRLSRTCSRCCTRRCKTVLLFSSACSGTGQGQASDQQDRSVLLCSRCCSCRSRTLSPAMPAGAAFKQQHESEEEEGHEAPAAQQRQQGHDVGPPLQQRPQSTHMEAVGGHANDQQVT